MGLHDRVNFSDEYDDLEAVARRASLVVLPSFSEGMPIVGQQTILWGCRVAWSRIPAHAELFGESGASFWTASELAGILSAEHELYNVSGRRDCLISQAAAGAERRATFWQQLAKGSLSVPFEERRTSQ
jgi:glycosyltransferase involved in cell wall biosynthesis